MIFPFEDSLAKLWNEARGDFFGAILAAIVLGTGGVIAAVFRKTILHGIRKILNLEPAAPPDQVPPQTLQTSVPPVQLPPQPVIFKFEGVPSPQSVNPESISPPAAVPRATIPRPPLAGFVARRDESGRDILERLKEELRPENEQLIVLWGAGGVGKTTLAAETARAMRDIFVGGIVWTTADGKPDFGLSTLLDEIATQLGRSDLRQSALEPKDAAMHHLLSTAPATLIVLDNFETISPTEQDKCAQWLANRASCPALITSREQVVHAKPVRVLAMSLPEAREFLQRLMSELGNPRAFQNLDPEQIIQAADRIPRVLQWVVRQIDSAREPQTVLDELAHGKGDAAERVFDRSFDLPQLGDDGRATLLALSLFVPDASRCALAEVAGFGSDLARLDRAVQQLVELWLVHATDGNERLRVEGLTREVAKVRFMRDASAEDYQQRFVTYFHRFAEEHCQTRTEDYIALDAEKDNLLNSMDVAFELAEWEKVQWLALAIATPVNGWLGIYGYWTEALRANQQALDAARQLNNKRQEAVFRHNLSILYSDRGELEKARTLVTESLQVFRELGDEKSAAIALLELGNVARVQGEIVEARRLYNDGLDIHRRLGYERGISNALHQLAMLAHDEREFVEASRLYNESLEIDKRLGNFQGISISLHQLALLAHGQGELEKARELYEESLQIKRQLGDQHGIADSVHELGRLAEKEGQLAVAEQLYNESLVIERKLGNQRGIAVSLYCLGRIEEKRGNKTEAVTLYRGALEIWDRLKSRDTEIARRGLERVDSQTK